MFDFWQKDANLYLVDCILTLLCYNSTNKLYLEGEFEMEIPNLGKLYQTFLDNERKMAEAYGVSHLYYLKESMKISFRLAFFPV